MIFEFIEIGLNAEMRSCHDSGGGKSLRGTDRGPGGLLAGPPEGPSSPEPIPGDSGEGRWRRHGVSARNYPGFGVCPSA